LLPCARLFVAKATCCVWWCRSAMACVVQEKGAEAYIEFDWYLPPSDRCSPFRAIPLAPLLSLVSVCSFRRLLSRLEAEPSTWCRSSATGAVNLVCNGNFADNTHSNLNGTVCAPPSSAVTSSKLPPRSLAFPHVTVYSPPHDDTLFVLRSFARRQLSVTRTSMRDLHRRAHASHYPTPRVSQKGRIWCWVRCMS
jgi:hypothetical protein